MEKLIQLSEKQRKSNHSWGAPESEKIYKKKLIFKNYLEKKVKHFKISKRRNDLKVHEVFFPFFEKISCKLYFQKAQYFAVRQSIKYYCNFKSPQNLNIAKAPKKVLAKYSLSSILLATVATTWPLYIILNQKSPWNIVRYFAIHSLERVPQWVEYSGIDSARQCLASNIVISPLSRLQPSSCSGHLQFQYSTSTPSMSRKF